MLGNFSRVGLQNHFRQECVAKDVCLFVELQEDIILECPDGKYFVFLQMFYSSTFDIYAQL